MNVKDCKMMQEVVVVAIASNGVEYEIRFSQLEYLGLNDLPCPTSFCSGEFDFHCQSLKEVMVTGCPDMKIFSEQVPSAPNPSIISRKGSQRNGYLKCVGKEIG